jgi:hypothetical protein
MKSSRKLNDIANAGILALCSIAVMAVLALSSGCLSTQVANDVADATYVAGRTFAGIELTKGASVAGVQAFAANLTAVLKAGAVTPYQAGQLNAQGQLVLGTAAAGGSSSTALTTVGNEIDALVQAGLGSSTTVNAFTSVAIGDLQNFSKGLTDGIAYYQGQQSILNGTGTTTTTTINPPVAVP